MTRPNIVMFVPDQLRADALGCFANAAASTPNIDALASRGTRFVQAFGQHPMCSPSRTSFLTGWYPHVHGNRTLTQLLPDGTPNALGRLKASGYHVAHVGIRGDTFAPGVTRKNTSRFGFTVVPETGPSESPFGPEHPLGRAFYVGRRDDRVDMDEACIRTAEDWLAEGLPEPWLLYIPLLSPHPPFEVCDPWFSQHDRADMPLPIPAGSGGPMFREILRERSGLDRLEESDWREIVATYYGMVSRTDHHLGRVLEAVDRAGAESSTAVLFFPDHGEYLGDFGLVEKWVSGVEPCLVRNPLVVATPDNSPRSEGALVELVDIAPTLYELAEIEAGYEHQGRSLVPLLRGSGDSRRDAVFTEGGLSAWDAARSGGEPYPYDIKHDTERDVPAAAGKVIAIRTHDWTYVHRVAEGPELYARTEDPAETRNLAQDDGEDDGVDDGAKAVMTELRGRMLDWLAETSDISGPSFPRFDVEGALFGPDS